MLIGVPKEIKPDEHRVGMTPASVREATHRGHAVVIQDGLGHDIGISNDDYTRAGARIVAGAAEVFATADMIVKVKEPLSAEVPRLRENQILFTYLHLAPEPGLTKALMETGCIAIAYETVTDSYGGLPLLAPMSEVAGRMSIQTGAHALEIAQGGRGMLLGGVPGTPPAKVVVLGGGVVGMNAVRVALGMEADVVVIDKSLRKLAELDLRFGPALKTQFATLDAVHDHCIEADLVIGAVLVPGAQAPKLLSEKLVRQMKTGAVLVDVSIDQGGCFATSRPTTHSQPTYKMHGVVHYCVTNMPGAVARTSTFALNNATLPFILALADLGAEAAMALDAHLRHGLNVYRGHVACKAVADATGESYTAPENLLKV